MVFHCFDVHVCVYMCVCVWWCVCVFVCVCACTYLLCVGARFVWVCCFVSQVKMGILDSLKFLDRYVFAHNVNASGTNHLPPTTCNPSPVPH